MPGYGRCCSCGLNPQDASREQGGMDSVDMLSFLFMLASLELASEAGEERVGAIHAGLPPASGVETAASMPGHSPPASRPA